MQAFLNVLNGCDRVITKIVRWICIISMMLIFIMFLMNIFVRFVPIYNFTQTDEWTQLLLVWVIFFGAQDLARTKGHFIVDVLTDRLVGTTLGYIFKIISAAIELTLYITICYFGFKLVGRSVAYMQTIHWLQIRYFYLVIPVSAFFMSIYSLRDLIMAIMGRQIQPPNAAQEAKDEIDRMKDQEQQA